MSARLRNLFPYFGLLLLLAALGWAVSFGRLPPADMTFCNGDEVKSLDPAVSQSDSEGNVLRALYEGLCQYDPKTLEATPGVAESWDLSDDKLTYTFHLRKNARWSDGSPVTAEDFLWSYRRFFHPGTAAVYAEEFWYISGSKTFSESKVAVGNAVEVELQDKPDDGLEPLYGKLLKIEEPKIKDPDEAQAALAKVFTVEIGGKTRRFTRGDRPAAPDIEGCKHVLPSFDTVKVRALDPQTLEIKLDNPTPYFPQLTGFFAMYPVNRRCVQKYHLPDWVRPENIVTNGPYTLQLRRMRDRVRVVKNPNYWNQKQVFLNVIDILPIKSSTTALNMYLTGQVDWILKLPAPVVPVLLAANRPDYQPQAVLGTYFYRINCSPPDPKATESDVKQQIRRALSNVLVRRALNMAIDKQSIVDGVKHGRDQLARSLVPPKMNEYMHHEPALCEEFNPLAARKLLAEAGYPEGRGFPKISILLNTDEDHRAIAEFVQSQWQQNLRIKVGIQEKEFPSMNDSCERLDYDVCRAGWFGDYTDSNTFINVFKSDNGSNQTGWKSETYDELLRQAHHEPSPARRSQLFHDAERVLMDEMPIIPLYFYASPEMARTYLKGWYPNAQTLHPYIGMSIDPAEKKAVLAREGK